MQTKLRSCRLYDVGIWNNLYIIWSLSEAKTAGAGLYSNFFPDFNRSWCLSYVIQIARIKPDFNAIPFFGG